MMYLTDVWYVAADARELADKPLARTILGRATVLYRTGAGDAVALADRCPHRFAPLHLGVVVGDDLQCQYHGLRFGPDGACVHNPQGSGRLPASAGVRRFPTCERFGFVWIWMGPAEAADRSRIPDLSRWADQPDHAPVRGYMRPRAHYELLTDNLMDLSHASYLHSGGIGSAAIVRGQNQIIAEGRTVQSRLWMPNDLPSPFYSARFDNYAAPVDHWLDMTWTPASVLMLDSGITPVGRPREEGITGLVAHILTPETETTTHYFWVHARSYKRQDLDVSDEIARALRHAFEAEDLPMVEAQQVVMGTADLWSLAPILLPADAAAVRVRRTLARLIKEQQEAGAAVSPGLPEHAQPASGLANRITEPAAL